MVCTKMAAIMPYCYIGHNTHVPPVAVATYILFKFFHAIYLMSDIVHEWRRILTADKTSTREKSVLHRVSNCSCAVQNRVRIFSDWFC